MRIKWLPMNNECTRSTFEKSHVQHICWNSLTKGRHVAEDLIKFSNKRIVLQKNSFQTCDFWNFWWKCPREPVSVYYEFFWKIDSRKEKCWASWVLSHIVKQTSRWLSTYSCLIAPLLPGKGTQTFHSPGDSCILVHVDSIKFWTLLVVWINQFPLLQWSNSPRFDIS